LKCLLVFEEILVGESLNVMVDERTWTGQTGEHGM